MKRLLLIIAFILIIPLSAGAQTITPPDISVPLFSEDLSAGKVDPATNTVQINWIAEYIRNIFSFGTAIAGVLAVLLIIYGGLKWTLARGDAGKISDARQIISGAVIGLLLLFGSIVILQTINPEIVSLDSLRFTISKKLSPTDVELDLIPETTARTTSSVFAGKEPTKGTPGARCTKDDDCSSGYHCVLSFMPQQDSDLGFARSAIESDTSNNNIKRCAPQNTKYFCPSGAGLALATQTCTSGSVGGTQFDNCCPSTEYTCDTPENPDHELDVRCIPR